MYAFQTPAFIASAGAAGTTSGLNAKVSVDTFSFAAEGLLSAGFARSTGHASSPTVKTPPNEPAPPPATTDVATYATATGGNLDVGWDFSSSGGGSSSVYKTSATYASSTNLLGVSWKPVEFTKPVLDNGAARSELDGPTSSAAASTALFGLDEFSGVNAPLQGSGIA